jgi:hypothetical protein
MRTVGGEIFPGCSDMLRHALRRGTVAMLALAARTSESGPKANFAVSLSCQPSWVA